MNNKKSRKRKHKIGRKTRKERNEFTLLPNLTPKFINEVSVSISNELSNDKSDDVDVLARGYKDKVINKTFSPSVNKKLVKLQSFFREDVDDCNNKDAFMLNKPLLIKIPNGRCLPYYDDKVKHFLLRNLSANKHIDVSKIITPRQMRSNCWFNTMFVSFFVSDLGRKFFHFLRHMMIEGVQENGTKIPKKLADAFSLLNYAIEVCLTGNKYAYSLNTNSIIKQIYKEIPDNYYGRIYNVNEPGNGIYYYLRIINYLNNRSLRVSLINNCNKLWKFQTTSEVENKLHNSGVLPHVIILEFHDEDSKTTRNRETSFVIKGAKYSLDSCIVRDTFKGHVCATLTCEKKEYAYDGASFRPFVPFDWKKKINSKSYWGFGGVLRAEGVPLKWSFMDGYNMLIYYRIE